MISSNVNNNYKNYLTTIIRKAKQRFYKNSFNNCHGDAEKTWNIVKNLLCKTKVNTRVKSIVVDGEAFSDESDIAHNFNIYFVNVATNLDARIPISDTCPLSYMSDKQNIRFIMRPVTVDECTNVIAELKNTKCGRDAIPVKLLKHAKDILAVPITNIINYSFTIGIFPNSLKILQIIPIFKKGSPTDPSTYRPISILLLFSQIFEKCVAARLLEYSTYHSIISSCQFSFQSEKSTVDSLLQLSEYL